jgi:hypothetical protein
MQVSFGRAGVLALCLLWTAAVRADTFTFTFNSLANNATDAQVQTYMNGQLGVGKSVMVTGAAATNSYNGEGHVTGPCTPTCTSVTLASNGGGTFIANNNGVSFPNGDPQSNDIFMKFSGLTISSVSFNLEIFPDGTCPSLGNCGGTGNPNMPDFEFYAGNGTQGNNSLQHSWSAVAPSGMNCHSPSSGSVNCELAPQLLLAGTANLQTFNFASGVTSLDFVDWPSTIGVDNITITTVPEPGSCLLFGSGILGIASRLRRKIF